MNYILGQKIRKFCSPDINEDCEASCTESPVLSQEFYERISVKLQKVGQDYKISRSQITNLQMVDSSITTDHNNSGWILQYTSNKYRQMLSVSLK